MERRAQSQKRYQSASYLTSGAVFYGTLLFLIARVFMLLQLFSDADTRKRLGQARRKTSPSSAYSDRC